MSQTLQQRKLSVIEQLARTDNKKVIERVEVILKEVDFWDELTPPAKASIKRGLADIKNGRTKPHSEVIKKYKKWL